MANVCKTCGMPATDEQPLYGVGKNAHHWMGVTCLELLKAEVERLRAIEAAALALTAVYPWYVNRVTDKYQCLFCDKLVAFGDKCIHNAGCPWAALESALNPQDQPKAQEATE